MSIGYNLKYDLQSDTVIWWNPPVVVHHALSEDGIGISVSHGLEDGVYTFESVSFSVYGVDDASVEWDMGDGTMLNGMNVEHFYTESDLYLITAAITTGDKTHMRQALLAVHNRPPVAVIDLYQEAWIDVHIYGTPDNAAHVMVFEDGVVVAETILVRTRGQPDDVSIWFPVRPGRNYTFSMDLQGEGANPFKLNIRSENSTSEEQNGLEYEGVLNSQQFPNFTMDLDDMLETVLQDNRRVFFDGSMSYDIDGYITDYYWMLDNETWVEGAHQEYVYPEQGSYTVHLFVLDNHNANGSASVSFNIRSRIGGDFELMPDYRWPPRLPYPIRIRPPIRFVIPGDRLYTQIRSITPDLPYGNWTWTTIDYVPGTGSPTMDWTWIDYSLQVSEGFQMRFMLKANNDDITGEGVWIDNITVSL